MKSKSIKSKWIAARRISLVLLALLLSGVSSSGAKDSSTPAASKQKEFNPPKEAADSLVQAAESFDVAALKEILGPDSADIISSEDQVADKKRALAFAAT